MFSLLKKWIIDARGEAIRGCPPGIVRGNNEKVINPIDSDSKITIRKEGTHRGASFSFRDKAKTIPSNLTEH